MTLLEVMLVVAFIAMLTSVGIPAFMGYMERTQNARALADIGSLSLQLKQWEANNGALPVTLADAGLDGLVDPWGNPYAYLRIEGADIGAMRKDKNLVPVNTDFDLYSRGKDGVSAPPFPAGPSRDDIVRAHDGAYYGLAEDF